MTVASPNLGSAAPRLPTVAVVVGSFNQAAFIESAIRSVAAQTYKDFDCVVVDDKSDDDSAERIRACLANLGDDRFRFIERETNGGQMAAMLTGLDATEAPFVAFLDGDDAWYSDFLDCHVRAHLSRAGAVAISSSDEAVIDREGAMLAGFHSVFHCCDPRREKAEERVSCVEGEGQDTLVFVERGVTDWLWSTTSGMMFRRTAVEVMRPIDPVAI